MPSTKVFIYNRSTGPSSQADLKELFTAYNIFNKPDVVESNFEFNLAGLDVGCNPTFVVPGGQALWMNKLKPSMETIAKHLDGQGYNYVGICAGGFVATAESHFFITDYQYDANVQRVNPSRYLFAGSALDKNPVNLGLVPEYTAVGSFYPNDFYAQSKNIPKSVLVPHRVKLTLNDAIFCQLYISGSGFIPVDEKQNNMVVATYSDAPHYDFAIPDAKAGKDNKDVVTTKRVSNLPAILCKKPKQESQGGVFLSGVHIETCVKESKLLKFFSAAGGADNLRVALSETDLTAFANEQKTAEATVVKLLKDTLRPG